MSPKFDFAAADRLIKQLNQFIVDLDRFRTMRGKQKDALLGVESSDNWAGPKRDSFEQDFKRQQAALGELLVAAMNVRGSVDTASERAYAANKNGD